LKEGERRAVTREEETTEEREATEEIH